MSLTKSELLQGRQARRSPFIEALNGEVKIRPLTDIEFHQVQMKFVSALGLQLDLSGSDLISGKADLTEQLKAHFDIDKFAEAEYEMNLLAAAYGLSVDEEQWSIEEVGQLAAGAPEQIAVEVFDLSGADPQQEALLRSFRSDGSGTGLRAPAHVRDPFGTHAARTDSGTENPADGAGQADVHRGGAEG